MNEVPSRPSDLDRSGAGVVVMGAGALAVGFVSRSTHRRTWTCRVQPS